MARDSQQAGLDRGLVAAAASCSILKVRQSLDSGANPNFKCPEQFGWTPLHVAAYFTGVNASAERVCKLLMDRGATPAIASNDGSTPISIAAAVGSAGALSALLSKAGYKARDCINSFDKLGKTPLSGAIERGSSEIVQILVDNGADCSVSDPSGKTPMDHAIESGNLEIVSILEKIVLASQASNMRSSTSFKR